MSCPKVTYQPESTLITLQFVWGPQNFISYSAAVAHDNLATGGTKERVVERVDTMIQFDMQAIKLADVPGWQAFMDWALAGGEFKFYPDASLSDYYNMVSDDQSFQLVRVGPGVYGSANSPGFTWRMKQDSQAASPDVVMQRYYGIPAPAPPGP
jgi:hypothetical protein